MAQREANLRPARHIGTKLDAVGCDLKRLTDLDWNGQSAAFSHDEVEVMAKLEHERWWEEKRETGWSYGPEPEDRRRIHPSLVPWEDLEPRDMEGPGSGPRLTQLPREGGLCHHSATGAAAILTSRLALSSHAPPPS